ncbi:MAG: GFA family protein [Steroidobacteraceae bacterium]
MKGSCLCGTLQYELTGPILSLTHCHCARCRRQNGAPFTTYAAVALEDLRWVSGESEIRAQSVPPGGPRPFCVTCGAPAPLAFPQAGVALIPMGTLEGDPGPVPQSHVFTDSKAPWHAITDAWPQHRAHAPGIPAEPLPDLVRSGSTSGLISGSCLCDRVGFEFSNPVAMFQCHCARCRKSRGSAHGANLFCKYSDFRWKRGESLVVDYKLPEARFYGVSFCAECGASVPRGSAERGIVVIPASSLDTDANISPMAHIYVGSKAPWFQISDALPQHVEGPPSFAPPR